MSKLAQEGVRAVKWSAVSTACRFLLQLGAQVALARILGPENYGIFGIGMVVLTLSNFLSNFGFGWNLLHKQDLSSDDIRFAFTWQMVSGLLAMSTLFFAAPMLASYFKEPRALPVIQWLSLACLFSAAAAPAGNLLQRDLNFKAMGIIQVGSYACGYVLVGIPLALYGAGVSALVAAWLTQTGVALLAMYSCRPHSLRPLFHFPGTGKAMSTSGTVFVTNIVNWCLNNADRVIIGRMLNVHAVGLYTAGYNLATMPNTLLLGALQPAFMSAASRMQTEPRRLGRVYLQMLGTVWVLALPMFVFLAAISADVVQLLYGSKWAGTADVLALLFLGMPAYVAWGLTTPVLWNTGRKHHEALLQLPVLVLGVGALVWSMQFGAAMAAAVASGMLVLRMLVVCLSAFRALKITAVDILPHVLRGMVLSALVLGGVSVAHAMTSRFGVPILNLAGSSLFAGVFVTACVLWRPKILGEHAATMLVRFVPPLRQVLVLPADRPEGPDV